MAHFAKVENGLVVNVIVAKKEFFDTFVDNSPGEWVKTSYNTYKGIHYDPTTGDPSEDQSKSLRKNFAGVGYTYDKINDCFIPPKPFDSWLFDETTANWVAPIPKPEDSDYWDEASLSWVS